MGRKLKRRYVLFTLGAILSLALLSSIAYGLYESMQSWPIYRHDWTRSGYAPVTTPDTNATLWIWEAPSRGPSAPIIANGIVYTTLYDTLYALDETTGVELWHVKVGTSGAELTGGRPMPMENCM